MMTGRFAGFLFGLGLAAGALMLPAAAEENDYIAVVGSGSAEQWPDYAEVTAILQATEKSGKDAIAATTKMLLTLAQKLKDLGISDDRIEFLAPILERKEDRLQKENGEWREVILGFESIQKLKVTVTDLGKIGAVITTLTNEGAQIRLGGVEFLVNNPNALLARARSAAIANARKKAQDYSMGSNRKLGKLLIVEENQIAMYRLVPDLREQIIGSRDYPGALRASMADASIIPLTPQPVSNSVTLYVKYALQ